MNFFETIKRRRSCRKYTNKPVPPEVIEQAIDAALLAPNSSNLQTWKFYWVQSPEKKSKLVEACLSQSAARTAQELVVCVADLSLWKNNSRQILEHFRKTDPNNKAVLAYYGKLIPLMYGWWILSPLKWLIYQLVGIFRPMVRKPWSQSGLMEVSIKSAALACENFMLAITALGYDTCPMEGFDECRVKWHLNLPLCSRVVMVISVGERDPKGIWGERYRVPKEQVYFKI